MISGLTLFLVAIGYLSALFAVAYWADKGGPRAQRLTRDPAVYALSIAVYCTSWTFYGSVGRATETGLGFLPIYLGPTLAFGLGWLALRKIVVISGRQRIGSIADFIAARYGKSHLLGGVASIIALVGTVPYIALQLKAVSASVDVMTGAAGDGALDHSSFAVAAVMAVFAMVFGARHIDATERHAGVLVAVAFESVIKLAAFLAVGGFVVFGLYDGFGDLFARAAARDDLRALMRFDAAQPGWATLTFLSAAAVICLPRQFHVTAVGQVDESHLRTAIWLFPLYLLLINIFVPPIALAGLLQFPDGAAAADTFVLALPMQAGADWATFAAFVGGLSAATAMVIIATIAVSIMVCNDLVMPVLLRYGPRRLADAPDLTRLLLRIRRFAMLGVVTLAFLYVGRLDADIGLVSIGLVSFCAAAQFAPALLGGLYWRGGTEFGALLGLSGGFAVWAYTLFLPSFLPGAYVADGAFGLSALRPHALFGLDGLSPITHGLFWSLSTNLAGYLLGSLIRRPNLAERAQATLFVDAGAAPDEAATAAPPITDVAHLRALAERFSGAVATARAFSELQARRGRPPGPDAETTQMVERLIAGVVGAASARAAIASLFDGARSEEVMRLLDETTQALEYGRRLERKSEALERATTELRDANERLRELDKMKDEFLSTVTHELRTPLTSIRALSELMHDEPHMPEDQRQDYLALVIRESERLTRLINQVLDVAKIESGKMDWADQPFDLAQTAQTAAESMAGLFEAGGVTLAVAADSPAPVRGDADRIAQVVVNLLSNAVKVAPKTGGRVDLTVAPGAVEHRLEVVDNGPGVPVDQREAIFDRFHQAGGGGNPTGTGLGLAISRMIVEHLGGRIGADAASPGAEPEGARFVVTLPARR